jgi:hypothetical protein
MHMYMNRKWRIAIIAAIIIIIAAIASFYFIWGRPNDVGSYEPVNHRPVLTATENTLGKDAANAVKDDLISREIFTGNALLIGEIEKLVEEKYYIIDENGYLVFGSAYPPPYFPVQKEAAKTMMAALLPGELVLNNGYLYVSGNLIIWPYGYSLKIDGKDMFIIDDKGSQIARVGDQVKIGGGEIPASSVEEIIGQPLPPDFNGTYWLAGDIVRD